MKEKRITTQKQLDQLKEVKADETVIIESDNQLELKCNVEVFGFLKINCEIKFESSSVVARGSSSVVAREYSRVVARGSSSVEAWGASSVEAWESSSVVARGSSSVVAWGSSSVVAWGSSRVVARESSSVVAWGSSSVVARESSRVVARGSSSVEARESSSVEAWESSRVEARGASSVEARESSSVVAWGSSSVVARESSRVVARESSSVEARGSSSVEAWGASRVELWDFSVCFKNIEITANVIKKSKTSHIQITKKQDWFERNGVKKTKKIILYKKVSKDFKTQEGTDNETLWFVGFIVTIDKWIPDKQECGSGKFHACSRPYFCDEFRDNQGDRYIAIEIKLEDAYPWENNPDFPYKIGFRSGKVLYECNRFGEKI